MNKYIQPLKWTKTHDFFTKKTGEESYRLMTHLSLNQTSPISIIEIGTNNGFNTAALAANPDTTVITYDDYSKLPEDKYTVASLSNVECRYTDILLEDPDTILAAKYIIVDIVPHDGNIEKNIYDHLKEINYNGTVIFDDIKLNPAMRAFWSDIDKPKQDITTYGHWSGTGIVFFGDQDIIFH